MANACWRAVALAGSFALCCGGWLAKLAEAAQQSYGESAYPSLGMPKTTANLDLNSLIGYMLTLNRSPEGLVQSVAQHEPTATQETLTSDEVFKNVQVLKGISVSEFMGIMGIFAASTGLNCTDCHVEESAGNWAKYADDTPLKQTARKMITMMNDINKANFGGARLVTCYSCHRGSEFPRVTPSLAEQYSSSTDEDPDDVEIVPQADRKLPSADEVLDRYIQALGGIERLAKLTSFSAKGTYEGWDTGFAKVALDLFAKAPNQRALIVHMPEGDHTSTYNGEVGWDASGGPVPVLPLTGQYLDFADLDASLLFPGHIKQVLGKWHTGFPEIAIDGRKTQVIAGTTAGGARVKLYFDEESGLLVRLVRFTPTKVGPNPTHVEYSDYRDILGVKLPFKTTVTWTSGRSTIELSEVQPNVPVDASKFSEPKPADSRTAVRP